MYLYYSKRGWAWAYTKAPIRTSRPKCHIIHTSCIRTRYNSPTCHTLFLLISNIPASTAKYGPSSTPYVPHQQTRSNQAPLGWNYAPSSMPEEAHIPPFHKILKTSLSLPLCSKQLWTSSRKSRKWSYRIAETQSRGHFSHRQKMPSLDE